MIEDRAPATTAELDAWIIRILRECGDDVEPQAKVRLARGDTKCVDVKAVRNSAGIKTVSVFECRCRRRKVTKEEVHAFRTVVADSGAHFGVIVSPVGFQKGAVKAAQLTNLRLAKWTEFEASQEPRWTEHCLRPRLERAFYGFNDLTGVYSAEENARLKRLSAQQWRSFCEWVSRVAPLEKLASCICAPSGYLFGVAAERVIQLPLTQHLAAEDLEKLPEQLTTICTARRFLEEMEHAAQQAALEFQKITGCEFLDAVIDAE